MAGAQRSRQRPYAHMLGKPEVLGTLIPMARQPMEIAARPETASGDEIGENIASALTLI